MTSREQRWEALYSRLLHALSEIGENVPSGGGDYWLVDDDWGDRHQKICVTALHFWSDSVRQKVQEVLNEGFSDWGVYVVFEDGSNRAGLIVYRDNVAQEK
jgi:hypothetical protein